MDRDIFSLSSSQLESFVYELCSCPVFDSSSAFPGLSRSERDRLLVPARRELLHRYATMGVHAEVPAPVDWTKGSVKFGSKTPSQNDERIQQFVPTGKFVVMTHVGALNFI